MNRLSRRTLAIVVALVVLGLVTYGAQDDFDVLVVNRQLESACAELVSLLVGPE